MHGLAEGGAELLGFEQRDGDQLLSFAKGDEAALPLFRPLGVGAKAPEILPLYALVEVGEGVEPGGELDFRNVIAVLRGEPVVIPVDSDGALFFQVYLVDFAVTELPAAAHLDCGGGEVASQILVVVCKEDSVLFHGVSPFLSDFPFTYVRESVKSDALRGQDGLDARSAIKDKVPADTAADFHHIVHTEGCPVMGNSRG